jgi:hypothetical protein
LDIEIQEIKMTTVDVTTWHTEKRIQQADALLGKQSMDGFLPDSSI